MKHAFFICLVLSTSFIFGQSKPVRKVINTDSLIEVMNKRKSDYIGKPYPQFSVTANETAYSNATLKGKVYFINFWFAACAPCIAEMEDLNQLFEKFRGNKNFEFISFTFEKAAIIDSIKTKYNIHYNIFTIIQQDCYRLNLNSGFPASFVIDAMGNIRYVSLIAQPDMKNHFKNTIFPIIASELSGIHL